MSIYKTNYRKLHFNSPGYHGVYGRQEQKRNSLLNPIPSLKLLRSPSQFVSSSVIVAPEAVRLCDDYQDCFAMESNIPSALHSINESKLASVVRKSLRRDNFKILGWRVRKLDGGVGNPVNLGLYRFDGVGVDKAEWLDWAVILKVIQSPENLGQVNRDGGDDTLHWNYWKRELLVYQSGWLDTLPEGIAAPRCFEAEELPGNIAGLWLEDINDSFSSAWPLYRYALAARHMGRLNGTYISRRSLPTFPWLSHQRTHQWLRTIPWREFPWDHPKARRQFPPAAENSFRRMLLDHKRYLAKLDRLPKTVTHGDTYPTNFKSRRSNHCQEQTVAMDWALTGIEPLGDDLGQLVYGTYLNLRGYKLQDISHTLFTSYLNGLEDSGCRVDPKWVRFGYVASAAFRVGLFKLVLLKDTIDKDEDIVPHFNTPPMINDMFESVMAEEASQLLEVL